MLYFIDIEQSARNQTKQRDLHEFVQCPMEHCLIWADWIKENNRGKWKLDFKDKWKTEIQRQWKWVWILREEKRCEVESYHFFFLSWIFSAAVKFNSAGFRGDGNCDRLWLELEFRRERERPRKEYSQTQLHKTAKMLRTNRHKKDTFVWLLLPSVGRLWHSPTQLNLISKPIVGIG